jgi:hypothetical protein
VGPEQHLKVRLPAASAVERANKQQCFHKQLVDDLAAVAAAAVIEVPLVLEPLSVSHTALLPTVIPSQQQQQAVSSSVVRAHEEQERRQKEHLEALLVIWSDKHHVYSDTYTHVMDCSAERTQLIKHYLQRRNLLDAVISDTCSRRDV